MLSPPAATPPACRGHTLSELLIASTIGLFIIAGLLHVYLLHAGETRRLMAESQLQRALGAAATLVTGELRRAGYWSRARETLDGAANGYAPIRIIEGECVLYSYDRAADSVDGIPGDDDRFGLRLRGGALQMKTSDGCGADGCESCDSGVWWAMTDPANVLITTLAFDETQRARTLPNGTRVTVRSVHYAMEGALARDPGLTAAVIGAAELRNDQID